MSIHNSGNAFALFGSAARGDHDFFSDRDLLIVSDDDISLRQMKFKYESVGWSCTAYSWNRLKRAADQGSLFVQHLKQEARILFDPSDRLAHILAEYSAKPSYKRELSGAASLVGNLIQHLPRCDAGPMWTLDVLSVGFRSLAVASLADNGIYVFSNSGITDGLTRIGMVSKEHGPQLNILRRFKSLYRRGILDRRLRWCDVFDWIRLVDKVFTLGLSSQCVRTIEILELALTDCVSTQRDSDWYARCRQIESALWMLEPRQQKDHAEFRDRRQRLFSIVRSPNSYAWHFTTGYKSVQSRLSELADICAV